jgi:Ca-activated chloride channel homolog
MNPRTARWVISGVGVVVLILAIITEAPGPPPPPIVEVSYVVATDAADLLAPLIKEFDELHKEVAGRRVHVTWTVAPSGTAVKGIRYGTLKPVAWTPGSSLWGGLLDAGTPTDFVQGVGPSLVQSPQVVAVFQTTSATLHLSSSERLQRLLDKSAAGELKLGHTDPNISTSGLSAMLSEFYLASEKNGESLKSQDVRDSRVRDAVRTWETSIVHYLDIGKDFKDLWCNYGPAFADAAYMQETTFLEFNRTCQTQLKAIYPTDIPLVADYPYIVLRAPWVRREQRQGATVFGQWLDRQLSRSCDAVAANGFRREGCDVPAELDPSQPRAAPPPPPDPHALSEAQRAWAELRRPANVMLVVDETLAMASSGKLESAREALRGFVDCPQSQDSVGMIVFGREVKRPVDEPVPLGHYSDPNQRQRLKQAIERLVTGFGRPSLYDAISRAFNTPEILNRKTINTIIVLTVGIDAGGGTLAPELVERIRQLSGRNVRVQILLVPYSDPAALEPLTDLVEKSLGRVYHDSSSSSVGDDATKGDVADVRKLLCQFL